MPRGVWVLPEVRRAIGERVRAGESSVVLAGEYGIAPFSVRRIRDEEALKRRRGDRSGRQLSFAERERISRGIAAGENDAVIGRALGRNRSTIGREIKRCGGRQRYRALRGEQLAAWRARRPKRCKLADDQLREVVEAWLLERWSPQQIAAWLRIEYPGDPRMQISHETIYRSLFVQGRGELRKELARCLRTGRAARRRQGHVDHRGQIKDMVMISDRPAEIEDRAVPGHWEGDLIIGVGGKSAIATLVERHTRYVLLAALPNGRSSLEVVQALKTRIQDLPPHLVKSLTWDQGRELAAHRTFTVDTGVEVYFCDPHSPWQRGSNENTNGLLRQYLPRKLDLAARSQTELDEIAASLNGRPRQTLDWHTPAEKMHELLLH